MQIVYEHSAPGSLRIPEDTTARPKHPQYEVDAVRLSSYSRWPVSYQNPVILTDAGFFYAGKSKYTAMDIMEIILDQEDRQTTAPSTTNTTHTTHTSSQTGASVESKASIASADSQSLFKENQTLKEQMLCKICLDKDACMVYLPCGHMVTCQDCAPTIRKCCICRKLIHGTVKAYL